MSDKLVELPGVRLKFRTEPGVITATVWIEDEPVVEVARLDTLVVSDPGQAEYHQWVDAVSALFTTWLSAVASHVVIHNM